MTRTKPLSVIVYIALGAAVGWLLEIALMASGLPVAIPPLTVGIALAVLGALVVGLAIPVRRSVRDRQRQIDPFYATRVVVLAKSSSIVAALVVGGGGSILVFLLSRSVIAAVGSVLAAGVTAGGAIALLVAALIAENMCSIPPGDDDKDEDDPAPVRPH
ncbi:MAG: hypothetical protein JWQ12_1968 [Glaciihabitans sp.]|nr:hypothetical protein [Glaciihabitans sp.]